MDWKLFAQLCVTFFVAACGWWAVHMLSSKRDLAIERRKLRVTYLLEAYRKLENAAFREDAKKHWADLESAVADIQLLGSSHQVMMARKLAEELATRQTSSLNELLFDLRKSLRVELQLEPVSEGILYLRFRDKPSIATDQK